MSAGEMIALAGLIITSFMGLARYISSALDQRFGTLRDDLDRRFQETASDTDRIERKVDKINGTVDRHEQQIQILMYRTGTHGSE